MVSVDKAAMIWSVAIVIIAVGFTAAGNNNASSEITYEDKKTDVVYPEGGATKQTTETVVASIFLQTDRQTYTQNDKIMISGYVGTKLSDTPIAMIVSAPNGDIVTIAQMEIDDDRAFDTTVLIGGTLWGQEGEYTIKVNYGEKNTQEINFNFVSPKVTSDTSDIFDVKVEGKIFPIEYTVTNAKVQDIVMDSDCFCMVIMISNTQDSGMLIMDLPRILVDAKMMHDGQDDMFFVLMDGVEIPYDEIYSNSQSRKIQINFEKGTSDLEVIGTMQR